VAQVSKLTPKQKAIKCLDFIDQRLEYTASQTIEIAEMMIDDIQKLNKAHMLAEQGENLEEYLDTMNHLQMKWMGHLNEIILEQTNRDLNGQVLISLNKFVGMLSENQTKGMDFSLPSIVARQINDHEEEDKYLDQEEIELLISQQNKNA